jgi:hypothetical protein
MTFASESRNVKVDVGWEMDRRNKKRKKTRWE